MGSPQLISCDQRFLQRNSPAGNTAVGDVVGFRKPAAAQRSRGKTLCRHGFHMWVIEKDNRFDSKQGRLVTLYRCSRCGMTKTMAH